MLRCRLRQRPRGPHWKGLREIQLNHAFTHRAIPIDSPGVAAPRAVYGIFKASTLRIKQIHVRFLRKNIAVAHVQTELLATPAPRVPDLAV